MLDRRNGECKLDGIVGRAQLVRIARLMDDAEWEMCVS